MHWTTDLLTLRPPPVPTVVRHLNKKFSMQNTSEKINTWADDIIGYWRSKKITLSKGASLEEISNTGKKLGFDFPQSFKVLYQKVDGFGNGDWNEAMIAIWSLERIEEESGRYPDFIGFGDFLINSHVYGFLKNQPGIFKNYDLADTGVPEKIADTFEEAIDLINSNSDLLY